MNNNNAMSGGAGENANGSDQRWQQKANRSILATKNHHDRGQRNQEVSPRGKDVDPSSIYAQADRSVRFANTEERSLAQIKKAGAQYSNQKAELEVVGGSPGSQQGRRGCVPLTETNDSYSDLIHGAHDDEQKSGLQFSNRIRSLGRHHPIEASDALPSAFEAA